MMASMIEVHMEGASSAFHPFSEPITIAIVENMPSQSS
jgi:hypothetical protein